MRNLSWWQARELARAGREVRRAAWPSGRWLSWRHNIAYQRAGTAAPAPVVAADVEPEHFAARDWTDEGAPADPPHVAELRVAAQSDIDDDFRITVGGVVVSDTRTPASVREVAVTAAQAEALGLRMVAGMEVEVDVFDGWAPCWITAPWVATVTWSDGLVETRAGGWHSRGLSEFPPHAFPYFEIDLYALFRTPYGAKNLPPGATFGVQTFGPYPYAAKISSHASNPAGADDTLLLNGSMIDDLGYAHTLFGGATTDIATIPAGEAFTVDIYNYGGECSGWGALRVELCDFTGVSSAGRYHPDGSFVL